MPLAFPPLAFPPLALAPLVVALATTSGATRAAADGDADGVPDHRDVCPASARAANVDRFGCRIPPDGERAALVLAGIVFAADESHLDVAARTLLDRVAAALLAVDDGVYEVAAHTDDAGPREHNLRLSERRAEAVRRYLMLRGVGPNRLRARGYGETRPLVVGRTASGRRANRRVELERIDGTSGRADER